MATPMQCLFFIDYGLRPRIFFYASGITPLHFCFSGRHLVDFINDRVYLLTSPTGFIAGQAIYYNLTKHWIAQAKHSRYSPDHIGPVLSLT